VRARERLKEREPVTTSDPWLPTKESPAVLNNEVVPLWQRLVPVCTLKVQSREPGTGGLACDRLKGLRKRTIPR
jgi:hypothetical protein